MLKYASFLPTKRGYPVGELGYHISRLVTYLFSYKDAHGSRLFLRVIWGPFAAKFKSREAKFIRHTTAVVVFASVAFYKAHETSLTPQSLETSAPVENETLKMDIQKCINNIPNDDKNAFQSATDIIAKIRKLPPVKSSFIPRIQKVLRCVEEFLDSIAICIPDDPQISRLGVGGLNCILTVSTLNLPY